jgi:hypothetical protein
VQWFAVDPDQDESDPQLMAARLPSHDVAGCSPAGPDPCRLRRAQGDAGRTPAQQGRARALIRANMDRWRWLQRDLGDIYLLTNVPEFQLRLTVETSDPHLSHGGRQAGPHRDPAAGRNRRERGVQPDLDGAAVDRQGRRAGRALLANPASRGAQNYKVTKAKNGMIYRRPAAGRRAMRWA